MLLQLSKYKTVKESHAKFSVKKKAPVLKSENHLQGTMHTHLNICNWNYYPKYMHLLIQGNFSFKRIWIYFYKEFPLTFWSKIPLLV